LGLKVWSLRFGEKDIGLRVYSYGLRVEGQGSTVKGQGLRVKV
jgi:hypothetical protein